jgi:putative flippase GtrA
LFLVVGGIAAAANFGSRFLFSQVTGFGVAVVLAFFVGLTTAFLLNRVFVFVDERATSWHIEAARFTIVNLLGLGLTLGVSLALLQILRPAMNGIGPAEALSHFAGIAATVVTSYFAHKYWTFHG